MNEVGISWQLWGKEQAEGVAEPQASVWGELVSKGWEGSSRSSDLGGPRHGSIIPCGMLKKKKKQAFPGHFLGLGKD